jgi:hypothetical protein
MKINIKQTIGFTIEIVFYVLAGFFAGLFHMVLNFPSAICFAIAFSAAIWTGEQIKKEALEEKE